MPACGYKKIFLKDLAAIPSRYRSRIERLVFDQIPESENIFRDLDIHKIRGYENNYRIRTGKYRIGCKITSDNRIVFAGLRAGKKFTGSFPE